MYMPPISVITSEIQTKLEDKIFEAVQNIDIEVDRDELIQALTYDRNQYEKGFTDGKKVGYAKAIEDVMHKLKEGMNP